MREMHALMCRSICRQPHNINTGAKNRRDEDLFPCVRGKRLTNMCVCVCDGELSFIRKPAESLVFDCSLLSSL